MHSKKVREFLEQRNLENIVETFREELLKIIEGEYSSDLMSSGVRRRMRGDGILEKRGYMYTVTSLGMKLLGLSKRDESKE